MAANYLALIAEVKDYYSERSDVTTARVDGFIDQVEEYLNGNIRTNEMETANGSLTYSSGQITNPSDFLGWKNVTITSNGARTQLKPINHEQANILSDGTTGAPLYYYVRGNKTLLIPTPDSSSYTISGTYYQRVPGLSASVTTNWVLDSYPSTYLYGCLVMACGFFGDDPRINTWKSYFDSAVSSIQKTQSDRNFGQVGVLRSEYPIY